jgi:hypothetical protein
MIKSKYCDNYDVECLADTLQDEDRKEEFFYGFMSAITFAHYKSLEKEEKELYCKETLERVIQGVGQDLMEEFLEEHFGKRKGSV